MISDFKLVIDSLFQNFSSLYELMTSLLLLSIPIACWFVKLVIRLFKRLF